MELLVNQVSPGILIFLLGFRQIYGPLIYRFSLSLVYSYRYETAWRHMAHLHTPPLQFSFSQKYVNQLNRNRKKCNGKSIPLLT